MYINMVNVFLQAFVAYQDGAVFIAFLSGCPDNFMILLGGESKVSSPRKQHCDPGQRSKPDRCEGRRIEEKFSFVIGRYVKEACVRTNKEVSYRRYVDCHRQFKSIVNLVLVVGQNVLNGERQ